MALSLTTIAASVLSLFNTSFSQSLSQLESAHKVLANLEDLKSEKSALEELVNSRGHVLLMSPKDHPELAGKGVEYAWGAAKLLFRKINHCKVKNMHINILRVMDTDYLTFERRR
eukprot:jgi/Tetstr1/424572/TSEL_015097.t1